MINVALPKGRLGEKVYKLLAKCGYACSELESENRKLVFTNEEAGVSYFWVKPTDVAIYVELGAADVGVVGKDTLVESGAEVYELSNLLCALGAKLALVLCGGVCDNTALNAADGSESGVCHGSETCANLGEYTVICDY